MYEFFKNIDRRWIFLLMLLAVAIPILIEARFPEKPTGLARSCFEEIENLQAITESGRKPRVLMAWDYDPASEGELSPMATAFVRHCCELEVEMYFMALWPVGAQMIRQSIDNVIEADFPHLKYGEDYINLGFKAGNEGVIKVVVTDLSQMYTTDFEGTPLNEFPMMEGIDNIQAMDLIINVSAGYPGTKEWIQYAVTPFPNDIKMVAGCTGVQAPQFYPYIPKQLPGLLGAIKGAAEYEELVVNKYRENIEDENGVIPGKYQEAKRRMGPQLVAHILMILLIIAGNIIFFIGRKAEGR